MIRGVCQLARLAIRHAHLDFFTGNTTFTGNTGKWMNAPKSAGFLYAWPERQPLLRPLIVS